LDRKINYTTNSNGVFFNLSVLPCEVIAEIDNIIKTYEQCHRKLRGGSEGAADATPNAPSVAPTPEATEVPVAPTSAQPPGEYAFVELFGGECIDPFDTAWASTFTVVDCATPHVAQLVYAGDLALDETYPSYPGDSRVGKAAMAGCSRKAVLNLTTAKVYTDLLVSAAYPISSEAWDSGDTRYYCFVNLASGGPIDGDLAGKLITEGAESAPEPTATP
jgi:hypothetical protein